MSAPQPLVTVPLRRSRPDTADPVVAETEGLVDQMPVEIKVTPKGLFLCVNQSGKEVWFGVNLSELARAAADEVEKIMRASRRPA